jgi:hypothetical protein
MGGSLLEQGESKINWYLSYVALTKQVYRLFLFILNGAYSSTKTIPIIKIQVYDYITKVYVVIKICFSNVVIYRHVKSANLIDSIFVILTVLS